MKQKLNADFETGSVNKRLTFSRFKCHPLLRQFEISFGGVVEAAKFTLTSNCNFKTREFTQSSFLSNAIAQGKVKRSLRASTTLFRFGLMFDVKDGKIKWPQV